MALRHEDRAEVLPAAAAADRDVAREPPVRAARGVLGGEPDALARGLHELLDARGRLDAVALVAALGRVRVVDGELHRLDRGEADVDAAAAPVAVEVDLERVAVVDRQDLPRPDQAARARRRRGGTAPCARTGRGGGRQGRGEHGGRGQENGRRIGIARVNSAAAAPVAKARGSDSDYPAPARPRSKTEPSVIQFARAAMRRTGRVAELGAREDRLVLRHGAAPGQPVRADVLEAVQPRLEPREEARHLGVAAPVDEDGVEPLVGLVGGGAVAVAQPGDEQLVGPPQPP